MRKRLRAVVWSPLLKEVRPSSTAVWAFCGALLCLGEEARVIILCLVDNRGNLAIEGEEVTSLGDLVGRIMYCAIIFL